MTVYQKISNFFSDRADDIRILFDKDLSLRFRLLNLLSWDNLRPNVAILGLRISDARKTCCKMQYAKTEDERDFYLSQLRWLLDRAETDIRDIWKL